MRQPLFLLASIASLAGLVACGDDSNPITGPDGTCSQVALATGQTVTGTLSAAACTYNPDASYSTFFDPYRLQLEAGQSYVFDVHGNADPTVAFAPALTLLQSTGNVVSQHDLGGSVAYPFAQMAFVASEGGAYSLRVHGYSSAQTGKYAVTASACGAAPIITDAIQNGAIAASDCKVHGFAGSTFRDSSLVDFYQVELADDEGITVRATSTSFQPAVYIAGPGFDTNCWYIGCNDNYRTATTGTASVSLSPSIGGVYTIMVGTDPRVNVFGTTGAYTIDREP